MVFGGPSVFKVGSCFWGRDIEHDGSKNPEEIRNPKNPKP